MKEVCKIIFISTGLQLGGAELMLLKILARLDRKRFEPFVISLTDVGPVGERMRSIGIPVLSLDMRGTMSVLAGLLRLIKVIRSQRPRIVQAWMYHANFIGSLACVFARTGYLIWGIRQSDLDPKSSKPGTVRVAKACGRILRFSPDGILCCSKSSATVHRSMGYDSRKMFVIPNGFDLDLFRPSESARTEVRAELHMEHGDIVVGLVARFDPQKDHETFIRAAGTVLEQHPEACFVLCGDGVEWKNTRLREWIEETGRSKRFRLLGRRTDIERVTNGFDIAVSSSAYGEGFCNALGEAMACGVCCVATDVGDSREIVADTGWVVFPRDPTALSQALLHAFQVGVDGRMAMGIRARRRIIENYDIKNIARKYENYYAGFLQ